jgi:hypothetical protein
MALLIQKVTPDLSYLNNMLQKSVGIEIAHLTFEETHPSEKHKRGKWTFSAELKIAVGVDSFVKSTTVDRTDFENHKAVGSSPDEVLQKIWKSLIENEIYIFGENDFRVMFNHEKQVFTKEPFNL